MGLLWKTASIAAALALLPCSPAWAGPIVISYSGKVVSGSDGAGIFGLAGADLAGADYTLDYTLLDQFNALVNPVFVDGGDYQTLYGGRIVAAPGPLSATITIAGRSFSLSGAYYSYASYQDNFISGDDGLAWDAVTHLAYGDDSRTSVYSTIGDYTDSMLSSASFAAAASYQVRAEDTRTGFFRSEAMGAGGMRKTDLTFEPMAFSAAPLASPGSVPEPATWAMLLSGFAAIGAVMRRARRRPEPATA